MPFADVETVHSRYAGLSSALEAALRDQAYTPNPSQVFVNMDGDHLIGDHPVSGSPASRSELFEKVEPHRGDSALMKSATTRFCREHQRKGPAIPKSGNDTFGHVCRFEALIDGVRPADSSQTRESVRAKLRDVIHDAPLPHRLSRQRRRLGANRLRCYQMWCYLPPDPQAVFAAIGMSRAEVVNLLGLGFEAFTEPSEELIRFAHRLPPGLDAFQPTAWDAEHCAYWRPGGFTWKLDGSGYGLSEVVHLPIKGQDLYVAIEPIP